MGIRAIDWDSTRAHPAALSVRATWSPTKASHTLLGELVQTFAPERDPLVMGIDETLWNDVEGGGLPQRGSTETPALRRRALRKDKWPQMDLRGALGGGLVGSSDLGFAVSVGVGLLRALHQRSAEGPLATDRVGLAAARIGEALVLGARDGGRSRSCLRLSSCSSAADV
jgi:hypothetical protein